MTIHTKEWRCAMCNTVRLTEDYCGGCGTSRRDSDAIWRAMGASGAQCSQFRAAVIEAGRARRKDKTEVER